MLYRLSYEIIPFIYLICIRTNDYPDEKSGQLPDHTNRKTRFLEKRGKDTFMFNEKPRPVEKISNDNLVAWGENPASAKLVSASSLSTGNFFGQEGVLSTFTAQYHAKTAAVRVKEL